MNTRHRIRLAGPWQAEILQSSSHQELTSTPLKAVLGETGEQASDPFHGELKLRRNFNLPTGLDEDSVVWLCTQGLPTARDQCQLFLNRQLLDKTAASRCVERQTEIPISKALESFNRIEIALSCSVNNALVQVKSSANSVAVAASVWLEIE